METVEIVIVIVLSVVWLIVYRVCLKPLFRSSVRLAIAYRAYRRTGRWYMYAVAQPDPRYARWSGEHWEDYIKQWVRECLYCYSVKIGMHVWNTPIHTFSLVSFPKESGWCDEWCFKKDHDGMTVEEWKSLPEVALEESKAWLEYCKQHEDMSRVDYYTRRVAQLEKEVRKDHAQNR